MIIPTPRKVKLELMSNEIELIIDELTRTEHNIYEFFQYEKLVKKLQHVNNKSIRARRTKREIKIASKIEKSSKRRDENMNRVLRKKKRKISFIVKSPKKRRRGANAKRRK